MPYQMPLYFNRMFYRYGYGVLSKFFRPGIYNTILKELDLPENTRILDSGTGFGTIFYADTPEDAEIIGLDYSSFMLTQAKELGDVVQASSTEMPFPDDSFDLVIDSWLMPHLAMAGYHTDALKEYKRIVKPGGKIIIYPSDAWNTNPMLDLMFKLRNKHKEREAAGTIEAGVEDVFCNYKKCAYFWLIQT